MTHNLSQQLADLSARAKRTEDSLRHAQQEANDKLAARKAQAHADATAAVAKVDADFHAADAAMSADWQAAKDKVSADMAALNTKVETARRDWDAKLAREHAQRMEKKAAFAIDYAIASVEQANLAVLDAVQSRAAANAGDPA